MRKSSHAHKLGKGGQDGNPRKDSNHGSGADKRVNRARADRRQVLKRARGRVKAELGEFFIVDLRHNVVSAKRVDISKLGEELGALQAYERLDRIGSNPAIKPAKASSKSTRRRNR